MEANTEKLIHKYEADFEKISSKESWSKEDIAMMKDLQKLMYYLEVRCAMKEGSGNNGDGYSYAMQPRTSTGRFMDNGRSGYYPMTSGMWNPNDISGRRYYDTEKENAIHKLHRMMDSEENPETRMAIQHVIRELESR